MTRILAIDFGEARIGLALSDPTRTIASPHGHLAEKDKGQQIRRVAALVAEVEAGTVLVGIPYMLDGSVGRMAEMAEKFAAKLETVIPHPVVRWDERFTSVQADEALHALGRVKGKRGKKGKRGADKGRRDAMAACMLLRDYLDHLGRVDGASE